MKEILECYSYTELYSRELTSFKDLFAEIRSTNINLTMEPEEYIKFIEIFSSHDAFKLMGFQITAEVILF